MLDMKRKSKSNNEINSIIAIVLSVAAIATDIYYILYYAKY